MWECGRRVYAVLASMIKSIEASVQREMERGEKEMRVCGYQVLYASGMGAKATFAWRAGSSLLHSGADKWWRGSVSRACRPCPLARPPRVEARDQRLAGSMNHASVQGKEG